MRRINVIAAVPFALLMLAAPHNVLLRARGQVTKPAGDPGVQLLANGVGRMEGVDGSSGIAYTRIFLSSAPSAGKVMDLKTPTLTLQCTKQPGGKLGIELFVNFGGIDDPAFYPPWRPSGPAEVFPPRTEKVLLTMEFLGYTKVKPMKRQFEKVLTPYGQLRYNPPGLGSANLEEPAYYIQYLRVLPTLRLSAAGQQVEFATSPLLTQLRLEPLCAASKL